MMLLSGHSAVPERKVPLESMSLTIKERDSTAEMVPADMTGIDVNSWLQDDTEPGRGIVWRVKSISNAYNTDTPKVSMEHAINLLKDRILFGEVKPSTITGNSSSTTCTALQAIRYILSQQSDWILDNFEYTNVYGAYKFDGDTLYDALVTVSNSLPDCWWSYNMNVYPFRLSITRKEDDPACEMRASRNLRTISKSIDKSGMFTRFYPIGYDDLELPEKYIDKNTSVYGVICKTETNTAFDSVSELRGWANERLHDHAEPVVTITVEALELSAATGEAMDHLLLGAVCRVPLTEYNTTLLERITQISIPDKISQPEVVKLTLCNSRTDVSTILAEILKSSSKSSRASTRQSKEDHAWIEDTSEHVSLTAKGIVGVDAKGNPNWTRLSQIVVDGTGIHQMVQGLQGDMVVANTKIEQNEYQITLEAQRASAAEGQLSGRITVEADRITQEVTQRKNADTTLQGKITVEANRITQEVTARKNGDTVLEGKITVEKNRITQEVTDRTNADTTLQGNITVEANRITAEVTRASAAEGELSGRITTEAGRITAEVTRAKEEEESLKGQLMVEADKVSLVVGQTDNRPFYYVTTFTKLPQPGSSSYRYMCLDTGRYYEWTGYAYHEIQKDQYIKAGGIVTAINEDNTIETRIDSDKVYIGNSTSTTVINGKCSLTDVTANVIKARFESITGNITAQGTMIASGFTYSTINGEQNVPLSGAFKNCLKSESGGVVELEFTTFAGTKQKVTFNAASAVTLDNPVWTTAAQEEPPSNSNTVTVSTSGRPGSQLSKSVTIYMSRSDDWDGNIRTVYVGHTDSTAANRVAKITVDASVRYAAGKNAAKVTGPTWATSPSSTPSSNTNTATFTTDATTPSAGTPKSMLLLLSRSDSWDGATRTVYLNHTDSTTSNRVAKIDVTAPLQDKSGSSNKITSNGVYTPSSGNIGFSKVQVDVPQRSVSGITFNGYGTPYDSSGWKMNITVNAAYSTGGSYSTAVTADVQNVYVLGHDSAHTMRVVDQNNNTVTTHQMSFGETLQLWPEVQQYDGTWYYDTNPYCVITPPSNPHPTLVKMRCSEAGQVPGQQLFRYKFTVEYTAAQSYTAGNDYNFYK